jgi:hypothetical protein
MNEHSANIIHLNTDVAPGASAPGDAAPTHLPDEEHIDHEAVLEKLADTRMPGYLVDFDPHEAGVAGAFREDALSDDDAAASAYDYPHFAPLPWSPEA